MRTMFRAWVVLVALVAGCDTQREQNDFADDASRPAEGYTHVESCGEILSEDADDWRSAPLYRLVTVDPICPNPSQTGTLTTLQVSVQDPQGVPGGLILRGPDARNLNRLIILAQAYDASQPGIYSLTFYPSRLGASGLHRLYLFDGTGEIVSYGDLLVE